MLFSHIASFCLFSLSIGSAFASPSPKPAALVRRQDTSDVLGILTGLQSQSNGTLGQITDLVNSGQATPDNISPLITELTSQITAATASLPSASTRRNVKRIDPGVEEIAQGLSIIVRDIVFVLDSLLVDPVVFPQLALHDLDFALAELIKGVEIVVAGVLTVVAGLLVDVAAILVSLSFTLTASALGFGFL